MTKRERSAKVCSWSVLIGMAALLVGAASALIGAQIMSWISCACTGCCALTFISDQTSAA